MKKNSRLLLILLGVLVLCCAVYGLMLLLNDRSTQQAENEEDAQAEAMSLSDLGDAVSISYQGSDGPLSFSKESEVWVYDADPDFPLEQSDVKLLASTLQSLSATRKLESGEDLASYGLAEPANTVTAVDADGGELTILLGSEASNGDYYAMRDGDDTVYTITNSLAQLLKDLNDLYKPYTIPYSGCTVDSVSLSGELAGTARTLSGLAEDESEEAQALHTAWSAMAFADLVAYQPDDEDLASCGLDEPALTMTVTYQEGVINTLLIGSQNEDGDYYAQLEGGDICTLPSSQVESLLEALAAL